jgi:predicted nucleic acid-binding protein
MFTLDTNILIYYAAGDPRVASFMHENQNKIFYVPTIVAVEFLSHPLIEPDAIKLFKLFLTQALPIGLDLALAEQAGQIRQLYGLKLADAVIAATALLTRSTLVTRNIRDFRNIPELRIISL